jgi:predicted nuclease of predicted toxin-antitoxin system
MRFLADESCDFTIVRALRAAGHDVMAVAEVSQRAPDPAVIGLAVNENRVLLTEDKDFGQLVYASGTPSAGLSCCDIHSKYGWRLRKCCWNLSSRKATNWRALSL